MKKINILFLLLLLSTPLISADPIPVYPKPHISNEGVSNGISQATTIPLSWLILVFLLDLGMNILIIYSGIIILRYLSRIPNSFLIDLPKKNLLASVFIISIIGIISEIIFGLWIGGLIIVILFIFLSFLLTAKKLLYLDWSNSSILGIIAIIINIATWSIIFLI